MIEKPTQSNKPKGELNLTARSPQPNKAYLHQAPKDILDSLVPYFNNKDLSHFSVSCSRFYLICKPEFHRRGLQSLLQAVIDDDEKKVKLILDNNPSLLLEKPEKLKIQSQLTWQTFCAEDALTMAVKRKQVAMIGLLLPYFDQLEQTDTLKQMKADALNSWTYYEFIENAQGEEELKIPDEYAAFIKWLIDVFSAETFPHGTDIEAQLSEDTEKALQLFRRITLPKQAVKLDDYLDPQLLLYAALKGYSHHFDQFQNWEQRDFFCRRVFGFIQSLQSRKVAEVWCESLYNVVEKGSKISDRAKSLKLLGGEPFYRVSFDSMSGMAGQFYCAGLGGGGGSGGWCWGGGERVVRRLLEKFCQATAGRFRTLHVAAQPSQQTLKR